jgi:sodium/hydrogen exchanger 8
MTVVFLMVCYFISEALITKYKPRFGHPSGVALVLGIVLSFIIRADQHDALAYVFKFEADLFFALILPPIVFSAGFNMHQRMFFRNSGNVALFGLVVTLVNFVLFGLATIWIVNHWHPAMYNYATLGD